MPRSWDDGLSPRERANLVRRLWRVWALDIPLDELPDEMASCLRCWRKPGTEFLCRGCGGDPAVSRVCACGGSGLPRPCGLCGGGGLMAGWTTDVVVALARDLGLPRDRAGDGYMPTAEQIRLEAARIRLRNPRPDSPG